MENQVKTYLALLIDALNKKEQLLSQLVLETIKQTNCFQGNDFFEEKYNQIYDVKIEMLQEISRLDDGFESLYDRIKVEMKENHYEYEAEIKELQKKIRSITDKTVRLQKLEQENKAKFQIFISTQRKRVKDYTISKRSAATYYKNMSKQFNQDSVFLNRTK